MPKFSRQSIAQLETVHPDLQRILVEAIKTFDFKVMEGFRTDDRQKELLSQKLTTVAVGKHNYFPSLAVDVYPWPIDMQDRDRFISLAWFIKGIGQAMGIKLRLGADWNGNNIASDETFQDLVHIELDR